MVPTRRFRAFAGTTRRSVTLAALVVIGISGFSACSSGSTGPSDAVATVTVAPTGETVFVGGTLTLTATPRDADGDPLSGKAVTWSTSNATVATVSGGVVTGVSPGGPVTITATSEGKSGTASVTVALVPVASVELGPTANALEVGDTHQLAAITRSATGTQLTGRATTWSSGDNSIASVSASGLVTAVGPGTTTITAISEGISASASITVAGCRAVPNPTPAGTLVYGLNAYTFTTSDGWRIVYANQSITIIAAGSTDNIQFWGETETGDFNAVFENLNGKLIKMWFGKRRSLLLPSGALITMTAEDTLGKLLTVSIYEGDQSHTFDARTFTLTHSCAGHAPTAIARNAAEADGETATFKFKPDGGTVFANEYTQDASETGAPLEKVPDARLLGDTGGPSNPHQVNDYYDDPRLSFS